MSIDLTDTEASFSPNSIVLTSCLDVYISRYGDFCAHDDNDDNNNDTTDYFTPCACARGNYGKDAGGKWETTNHIGVALETFVYKEE